MKTDNEIDYGTIGWVKGEIDQSLDQTRQALEAFVDDPDDATQLRFCATHLHQVTGTLRMVELYGAARLGEEMEAVVQGLIAGTVTPSEDAYEVLMRAILQLPDYLERVQGGMADQPLVLLPLLNDLRAARGEPLLSESALFATGLDDLDAVVIGDDAPPSEPSDAQSVRGARHQFQVALLGWIRDREPRRSLEQIGAVLARLEGAGDDRARRLWWVAGGVIEALLAGEIEASVAVKKLIGQLDRELKRVIDGAQATAESTELLRNLLYHVARASGTTPRVQAVKDAFDLDGSVPGAEALAAARQALAGPNSAALATVAEALCEDLAAVKDALDLFLRSGSGQPHELASRLPVLDRVGDTLGMLGLGTERRLVQEQAAAIAAMLEGEGPASDEALLAVAGALLSVESSLRGLGSGRPLPEPSGEASLPAAEVAQGHQALLGEVGTTVGAITEAIGAFADAPWDHGQLADVPGLFDQVRGAVQMLGMRRLAEPVSTMAAFVQQRLAAKDVPASHDLDALAEAISALQYFLEAELEGRAALPALLDRIEASLARLGRDGDAAEGPGFGGSPAADGEPFAAPPSNETAATQAFEAPPLGEIATTQAFEAPPLGETATTQAFEAPPLGASAPTQAFEATPPGEVASTGAFAARLDGAAESEEGRADALGQGVEEIALAAPPEDDAARGDEASAHVPPGGGAAQGPTLGDLDDDILEIFIEEAQEELAVIVELLARWREERTDDDSLGRMRRAFHTLKGSGRLVGAVDIGEVAWSVENMLNRVLDGTLEPGPCVVDFLEQATAVLPALVAALQRRSPADADVGSLIERGFAIAEGKVLEEPAPEQAEQGGGPEDARPSMDPVLYEIFSKESAGHIAAIAEFLERCQRSAGSCEITDGLIRSLHTLHGSARMAGADAIAALAGGLEKYAKAVLSNDSPLTPEGVGALVESMALVKNLLSSLNSPDAALPEYQALSERVRALYEAESARVEARLRSERESRRVGESAHSEVGDKAEYDPELLAVFLQEGAEILESSERTMQRWREDKGTAAPVAALQRHLHTLKGGARMAGIGPIGDLAHRLESLLDAIAAGRASPSPDVRDLIHRALDRLYAMLEQAQEQRPVRPAPELIAAVEAVLAGPAPAPQAQSAEAPAPSAEVLSFPARTPGAHTPQATPPRRRAQGQEVVRVRAELLDHLVNHAGEVSIYRARLEQNVGAFGFNLVELEQTVARLRDQLRKLEIETEAQILYGYEHETDENPDFDPLEMDRYSHMQQLSRSLLESAADISSIQGMLETVVRDSETLLLQQSRVNTDLQEGLMRTRMVPFTGVVSRLRRLVRQTCQELDKAAELHAHGEHGEMDRTVLERIVAPLEHMLRNAIAHGIEAPAERRARGKPDAGVIRLSMEREGSEVVITVQDDGAGIDLAAIRRKASERGLIDAGVELSDHEVMQFILEAGFSTANEVTQIAGRGVGMDVVSSEIKQLGGSLEIDSVPGAGTTFTVRLPFTLAVNQALLVGVGEEVYAFLLTGVEGIVRVARQELAAYLEDPRARFRYGGAEYQVQPLAALLGAVHAAPEGQKVFPLLLVRSGDHRVALQVEALLGSREVVVKSLGPQLSTIRGLSGATILGDGRVVLILDAGALIRASAAARVIPLPLPPAPAEPRTGPATVMVVDDSITVRKVTTRLLVRNGLHAVTAKDGVDAVALLQEQIPDLMLLDIEMPRMDGFELATHIRNEARLKHIPIVMITSRTGDKHRRRAMEIGVNRYLGKPYQEGELLETIQALLQERGDGT